MVILLSFMRFDNALTYNSFFPLFFYLLFQ